MNLMFTQTQDQALLAFVIQEAAKVANESGKWVGRTAVQKIMYFLGVRGVSTNYKFDIYHYGPFCEQILWDIDLLMADGVIEDKSMNTEKFSNYSHGQSIDELINLHKSRIDAIQNDVREIVRALVPLKPDELELTSTLDFIYRQQRATGTTENLKDAVISRFQQVKKDKFPVELVAGTYDAMVNAHLVRA
jgi:uncharacterized protein